MVHFVAMLSLFSSSVAHMPRTRLSSFARNVASMSVKEGDVIPNVIFKARVRDDKIAGPNPFTWKDVSSESLFKGKRAVVFALPGGIISQYNNLK